MITSKEVIIPVIDNLTSEYIESELENLGFDVLRWSITRVDCGSYIINVSYIVRPNKISR